MMKLNYVAILLMIFINCLRCVHNIKCYQCRSDLNKDCEELESEEFLLDCTDRTRRLNPRSALRRPIKHIKMGQPFCRKITQALHFTSDYLYTTIRECAYIHGTMDNCYKTPWTDSKVTTCDCREEACNRGYSGHRKKSFFVIFLCTVFSLVWWRFFLRNIQALLLM